MPSSFHRGLWAGILALWLGLAPALAAGPAVVADAAERSDAAEVEACLARHADVDAPQPDGMTAWHWAALRDDLKVARLLTHGRVAVTNRFGVTPLSLACQNGSAAMVDLLLEGGADPNTALRGGETVLMTAARTGRAGPVRALLTKGAAVDAKERHGQTALMWAAAEGNTEVVELLLGAGADLGWTLPDSGFNAWFFAVREGRGDVVRALLKAGADVKAVLEPGRPTGKGPRKGTAALLLAVENGHFELALDLVRAGADPNDQRSGFTPLHAMSWVRKPQRGEDDGDPAPLGSGRLGSLGFIRELVRLGADVNARLARGKGGPGLYSMQGATAFLMASATADVPYMNLLLELGADPALGNVDRCTPLLVACGVGVGSAAANEVAGEEPEVLEAARLLLRLGADPNAVDGNGETVLHAAAYKNLPSVIRFLGAQGARAEIWNRTNRYGWTPLAIAEGHRPGNFKPSVETAAALRELLPPTRSSPPPEPTQVPDR